MNIIRRELKTNLKTFIYWSIGLFFLVFAGIVKFTGVSADGGEMLKDLIDKFPKIVLAMFGMSKVDATSIEGYYSIIAFYSIICIAIYAVSLGTSTINREIIDKTHDFIFTKPRSRKYIINMKAIGSIIYLIAFSILNCIFSLLAIITLKLDKDITNEILLYTLVIFIIGILFYTVGMFIGAVVKKSEKASTYGYLFFIYTFIVAIIYDMTDNVKALKILTPIKYFEAANIISGKLDYSYLIICIIISIMLYIASINIFNKKELN